MLNKVLKVFTKEYREETSYKEMAYKILYNFKLKSASESIEDKIKRLSDKNFVSKFKVNVGDIK